jgi:hypothetical protein
MKTSTRRWFGAALIGASILSGWLVAMSDIFPKTVVTSETHSSGATTATMSVYSIEVPLWLRMILLASIIIGLLLLIWPKHERTNA